MKKTFNILIFVVVVIFLILFVIYFFPLLSSSSWNSDLNNGLVSYYNFEGGSGTLITDSLNRYNMTSNSSSWVAGKIGTHSMNFLSNEFARTTSNVTQISGTNVTIGGWVKIKNSNSAGGGIFKFGHNDNDGAENNCMIVLDLDALGSWYADCPNTITSGTNATLDIDKWVFMILEYNIGTNNLSVYRNNDLIASLTTSVDPSVGEFQIAKSSQNIFQNGQMDEIGVWNRTLNSTEKSNLYNNGLGITYNNLFYSNPNTILNSPADKNISSSISVTYNASANMSNFAFIKNISLYTNSTGTWHNNQTINVSSTLNSFQRHNQLMNQNALENLGNWGRGMLIEINQNITLNIVTINTTNNASKIGIFYLNQSSYANATISNGNATFNIPLYEGQAYYISALVQRRSVFNNSGVALPISNTFINWTKGVDTQVWSNDTSIREIIGITVSQGNTSVTQTFTSIIPSGNTTWNVESCSSENICGFASNNFTLTLSSCVYTSGNWSISLSDNCYLNTETDIYPNSLIITGASGSLTINKTITMKSLYFTPSDFNGDAYLIQTTNGAVVRKP